jgi:hypothetical protein
MDNNKKITIENSLKNDNKLNKLIKNQYVSKTDKPKTPLNRKSLLFILISILICGIVVMYFIFGKTDNETYKVGFSYSPRDITNIETNPPIDKMVNNVNKCIEECNLNGNCNGVTFNKDTYKCIGYNDGVLMKNSPNMLAWAKDKEDHAKESKSILLHKTFQQTSIKAFKMAFPYGVYDFNFSFKIHILDWYNSSHGYWKCVFFKGRTDLLDNKFNKINKTQNWEDIIQQLPEQCIGVWLAPYTNNLRICVTTERTESTKKTYPEPHQQICHHKVCINTSDVNIDELESNPDYSGHYTKFKNIFDTHEKSTNGVNKNNNKNQGYNVLKTTKTTEEENNKVDILMEYYDILNVPLDDVFFISVNIDKNIMEIYVDGKLNFIINLEGLPLFNKDNLNVKNETCYNGYLYNINYIPSAISFKDIKKIYKLKINNE